MTQRVDEIQARLDAALCDLRDLRNAKSAEIRAAEEAVHAKFRDSIRDADAQIADLRKSMLDAKTAATPDHPWEGNRVKKIIKETMWGRTVSKGAIFGVVRTIRPGMDYTGRAFAGPRMNEPAVFLLKKDGKPGKRAEHLSSAEWELDEAGQ